MTSSTGKLRSEAKPLCANTMHDWLHDNPLRDKSDEIRLMAKAVLSGNLYFVTLKKNATNVTAYKEDYYGVLVHFYQKGSIHQITYELDTRDRYHVHFLFKPTYKVYFKALIPDGYHVHFKRVNNLKGILKYLDKDKPKNKYIASQQDDAHYYRHNYAF